MENQKSYTIHPLALVFMFSFGAFLLACVGFMSFMFSKFSTGKSTNFNGPSVGIVEIVGGIFDSKKTLSHLEKAQEDDRIKAVVLRLNSPGGAVAPSQEIYEAIKAYPKPLVVSMASVAASGAFYIACGAKKVYANPGTITGSIGVIMQFANLGKLYDFIKIKRYSVKTGQFKDAGADYRELSHEENLLFETMLNNVLSQFKHAIQEGRHLDEHQVNAVADGRIFSGEQAKQLGLVDTLGTLQDAISEAGQLGGISGKPKSFYVGKPKRRWLDLLLDEGTDESQSILKTVKKVTQSFKSGLYLIAPDFLD